MTDMNDFNKQIIEEFRANEGVVGGPFAGSPVLLLTTTGRKSGQPFTTPLVYHPGDGSVTVYVFASKAGAPTNPDWYHNLLANPTVTVELGPDRFEATASDVKGEDRDRVYASQADKFANFAEYQKNTTRVIPVVALTRT